MTTLWIHTYTGRAFDLLDPKPEQIHVADIAHSGAWLYRYTGHGGRGISIGEHMVLGAWILYTETGSSALAFEFLFHDAHEPYGGDVASPIKRALRVIGGGASPFDVLEDTHATAVRAKYGLPLTLSPEVALCDLRMLATEGPQVFPWPPVRSWQLPESAVPYDPTTTIKVPLYLSPAATERAWLVACQAFAPPGSVAEVEAREAIAWLEAGR